MEAHDSAPSSGHLCDHLIRAGSTLLTCMKPEMDALLHASKCMRDTLYGSFEFVDVLSGSREFTDKRFPGTVLMAHGNGSLVGTTTIGMKLSARVCFYVGCELEPVFGQKYCTKHAVSFTDMIANRKVETDTVNRCALESESSGTISLYSSAQSSGPSSSSEQASDSHDMDFLPEKTTKMVSAGRATKIQRQQRR